MGVIRRNVFRHVTVEENPEDLLETVAQNEDPEPVARTPEPSRQPFLPAILPHGRGSHVRASQEPSKGRVTVSQQKTQEERYPRGHKKRRRYENNRYLLNLAADNDADGLDEVAESRSVFTQLLQEKEKMQAWNQFLSFSEENQALILSENSFWREEADPLDDSWVLVEDPSGSSASGNRDFRNIHPGYSPTEAFDTMCARLKAIFKKRHFPMATLSQLETEICGFFHSTPKGVFILELDCSYDRLILHAICHYNSLHSQSFTGVDERRETRVRNFYPRFSPPEMTLTEFVRQHRS